MGKFTYKPLPNPNSIRILKLAASPAHNSPLIGTFIVTSLKDAPNFEAISYVWGDQALSENIRVDSGTDDISITPILLQL